MANKKVERKKKADPKYLEKKKIRVEKKTKVAEKKAKVARIEKKKKERATELAIAIGKGGNEFILALKPKERTPSNPLLTQYFVPRLKFDLSSPSDYHAWVEDDYGNVIFDPFFDEELHLEAVGLEFWGAMKDKPRYIRWDESEQKKQTAYLKESTVQMMTERDKKRFDYDGFFVRYLNLYSSPRYDMCWGNARAYVAKNKLGKVVIGAKGYERADGFVYFRYG